MNKFTAPLTYAALAAAVYFARSPRSGPADETTQAAEVAVASPPEEHRVNPTALATARGTEGRAASPFQATTADGVVRTMADLATARPLVLVFIKDGCPCSESAQPFLNRLHELYGGGAQFAGVIDAAGEPARRWKETNNVSFPLLLDPELEIVRRYGVENSAYVALVGRDGKVMKAWPGYSADMLRELGRRLHEMTGSPEGLLALADAPKQMYSGCPY